MATNIPRHVTGDAKKSEPARSPAVPLSRKRRVLVWTLVVLGSVIMLVSILSMWVERQVLDNDSWTSASKSLIQDPKVQDTLSVYIVNQLYDNVDVAAALEQRLPSNLDRLAAPIAGALRGAATQTVHTLLERPQLQQRFVNASSFAHQRLVNVLEDKTGFGITTGEGTVTINLRQMITEVAAELGLPGTVISKLPPDAGRVVVLKTNQLDTVQSIVKGINVLSVWLLFAVLAIYALAIFLARGIRRQTLRNIAFAFIVVGLLVVLVRRFLGNHVVDALTSPEYEGTVRNVFLIGSKILGDIGRATIFYGVIGLIGAILAGPSRLATRARSYIAPTINRSPGVGWGIVFGLFLLLVLWGPTHALRTWWGILLLAGLLALGFAAFARQLGREFPAGAGEELPARLPGAPEIAVAAATSSAATEIARLSELHDSGRLTDEEFEQAKKLVLT